MLSTLSTLAPGQAEFRRGDADGDGHVFPVRDALTMIQGLFSAAAPPLCPDAHDANDDGSLNLADVVEILAWGYIAGSPAPPPPGPDTCGADPTPDTLSCDSYDTCLTPMAVVTDSNFEYRLPVLSGEAGATATVSLELDNTSTEGVSGWSAGICHDPAILELIDVAPGVDMSGDPDFFEFRSESNGFAVGAISSLLGTELLSPESDLELLTATYALLATGISPLAFCDDIADLTMANHVAFTWEIVAPTKSPGEITVLEPVLFRRGDTNGDGLFDIADPIFGVIYLFAGGAPPLCEDAGDANDDGTLDVSDAIHMLSVLFDPAAIVPEFWEEECSVDPTTDGLGCAAPPSCP